MLYSSSKLEETKSVERKVWSPSQTLYGRLEITTMHLRPLKKRPNDASIRQKLRPDRKEGGPARAAQHSAHGHDWDGTNMTDLFHAITQGIDSVLTCHYFDSFRENNRPSRSSSRNTSRRNSMSDKMLDTEPGGENTQYESIKTVTEPAEKQSGQLGGDSSNISEPTSGVSAERGQQTADNVGYGQNVSESGIGGMTTTSSGDAQQGGYGGTEAQDTEAKNTRREQGMGPGNNVGA